MRMRIVHLLAIVLAAAILINIYQSLWGPQYVNAKIVFGAYVATLVTTSIASWSAKPRWRRLWLGYSAFGWCWVVLVLRPYLELVPDHYSESLMRYGLLGMGLGVLTALASQSLPGMKDEPPSEPS